MSVELENPLKARAASREKTKKLDNGVAVITGGTSAWDSPRRRDSLPNKLTDLDRLYEIVKVKQAACAAAIDVHVVQHPVEQRRGQRHVL